MQFEQLSLELYGKPKERNIRDVKCKFEAPLRRYFCEDNWYAIECRGCPNYQKENIYEDIENSNTLNIWERANKNDTNNFNYIDS